MFVSRSLTLTRDSDGCAFASTTATESSPSSRVPRDYGAQVLAGQRFEPPRSLINGRNVIATGPLAPTNAGIVRRQCGCPQTVIPKVGNS